MFPRILGCLSVGIRNTPTTPLSRPLRRIECAGCASTCSLPSTTIKLACTTPTCTRPSATTSAPPRSGFPRRFVQPHATGAAPRKLATWMVQGKVTPPRISSCRTLDSCSLPSIMTGRSTFPSDRASSMISCAVRPIVKRWLNKEALNAELDLNPRPQSSRLCHLSQLYFHICRLPSQSTSVRRSMF